MLYVIPDLLIASAKSISFKSREPLKQVKHFKEHRIKPALDTQGAQLRVSHNYDRSLRVNIGDIITLSSNYHGDSGEKISYQIIQKL